MKIRVIYILIAFFLFSCKRKENNNGSISDEKMKIIFFQLLKVDEHVARMSAQDSTWKNSSKSAELYQKVFDLNKVDRVQFYKQVAYFESHPIELKVLLDSVNELSKREKNAALK